MQKKKNSFRKKNCCRCLTISKVQREGRLVWATALQTNVHLESIKFITFNNVIFLSQNNCSWTPVYLWCYKIPTLKWKMVMTHNFAPLSEAFSSVLVILCLFIQVSQIQESRMRYHLCSVIALRNRFSLTDSSNWLSKVTQLQPHPLHPICTLFCYR